MVRAEDVRADGALTAKTRGTVAGVAFVDVNAPGADVAWIESESLIADAGSLLTVDMAGRVLTTLDAIARRSASERCISDESLLAQTAVVPFCILADCIEATGRGRQIALVDVPALAARQPLVHLLVAGLALALIAALRVEAFSAAAADVAIFAFIHVNAVDSVDLIALVTLAVTTDTGGVFSAIVVELTGDVHCCTITSKLR